MHEKRRHKNVIRDRHAAGQIDDLISGKQEGKDALEIDAPALPWPLRLQRQPFRRVFDLYRRNGLFCKCKVFVQLLPLKRDDRIAAYGGAGLIAHEQHRHVGARQIRPGQQHAILVT